jgi:hypothetical protein
LQKTSFREQVDRVGAVTGTVAEETSRALTTVCEWARSSDTNEVFMQRFVDGANASAKLPALENHRAGLRGAALQARHRPIPFPTFGDAQDRGGAIAQAAAHAETDPRGLKGVGVRGPLRQSRGVREDLKGGAIRQVQSGDQTNNRIYAWTCVLAARLRLTDHRKVSS